MTYKLDKWPITRLREVINQVQKNGYANEPWRIAAWRQVKDGDSAFIFKQGANPRGIIGVGTITGKPELNKTNPPDPSKPQYFAPTRWRRLVDPTKEFLLGYEDIKDFVPASLINTQSSGITVSPEIAVRLHELLPQPSHSHPDGSDDNFNPSGIEDGRERIMATIHRRQGQGSFPRNAAHRL